MSSLENVLLATGTDPGFPVAADFRNAGYRVVTARSGEETLRLAASFVPDLILVDQALSDISALDVCRRIRNDPQTEAAGVIIVGPPADEEERVAGFEVGADDVVSRPVGNRELVMRARAVLRRKALAAFRGPRALRIANLTIDHQARQVKRGDTELHLTALEFQLLWTLVNHPGVVLTRTALLREVWGHVSVELRTVDQHMKRLRQKLGSENDVVRTVRGVGYQLVVRQEESRE